MDVAVKTVGLTIQKQVVSGRSYQFEDLEIGDSFEGTFYKCLPMCTCKITRGEGRGRSLVHLDDDYCMRRSEVREGGRGEFGTCIKFSFLCMNFCSC